MRTDSPRTSETIPMHGDPMTDPTRLRDSVDFDAIAHRERVLTALLYPGAEDRPQNDREADEWLSALATPDPAPAPDVEAAWASEGRDIMRQLTEWAGRYGGLPQTLQNRADSWRLDSEQATALATRHKRRRLSDR